MSQADLSERNRPLSVAEQSLHFLDRVHIGPPPGPIRTAAAWRSSDFDGDDAWIQPLGDAEIAAFDAAIAFARLTGKPLDELGPEDFPFLPFPAGSRIGGESWRRDGGFWCCEALRLIAGISRPQACSCGALAFSSGVLASRILSRPTRC
jgi:hypothetical protein